MHGAQRGKTGVLVTTLTCLAAACAHQEGAKEKAPTRPANETTITLHPKALEMGPSASAAWVGYGAARVAALQELPADRYNDGGDDFSIELVGHRALISIYRKALKGEDAKPEPYLDKLLQIDDAGFLREYILFFFAQPGWTLPESERQSMKLDAFVKWATDNLQGHGGYKLAETPGPSGSPSARNPAANLPEAQALSPEKVQCQQSRQALQQAVSLWAQTAAQLDGTPISAVDAPTFARIVSKLNAHPRYHHNTIWVPADVFQLHYYAGFCAIDARDAKGAVEPLNTAVTVAPFQYSARTELAHALINLRRLDEADQHVQWVIDTATDACALGVAWRKRGYILFERGKLNESRAAYLKSLEYEPNSKIAQSEIALIEGEFEEKNLHEKFGPYIPPPQGNTVTTKCGER